MNVPSSILARCTLVVSSWGFSFAGFEGNLHSSMCFYRRAREQKCDRKQMCSSRRRHVHVCENCGCRGFFNVYFIPPVGGTMFRIRRQSFSSKRPTRLLARSMSLRKLLNSIEHIQSQALPQTQQTPAPYRSITALPQLCRRCAPCVR